MDLQTTILAYGTSEGVKKAWDTRGRRGKADSDKDHIGKMAEALKSKGYGLAHKPTLPEYLDNEYVFRKSNQQTEKAKDYIHVNNDNGSWEHKQYSREPFGDYTTSYSDKGKGVGTYSLKEHLSKAA